MGFVSRLAIAIAVSVCVASATVNAAITIVADPAASTASSSFSGDIPNWGPQNLYDTDPTVDDLNTTFDYGAQYAGDGVAPHVVVFNYDAPVTFDGFAYAQRAGADPEADKVPAIDIWVSDTDPGPASLDMPILATTPGASVTDMDTVSPAFLTYDFGGTELTGQHVVVRLNEGGTFNPGGNEMALLSGVPEPTALTGAVIGALGLLGLRRRRSRR